MSTKKEINAYYDLLREIAKNTDYSCYPFPHIVYNAELERIEAARCMALEEAEEE